MFFQISFPKLYGTSDLHFQIRLLGIAHLNNYPELYVESIGDDTWENYMKQMSNAGTWCDNVVIQAVANWHNCVIHITESDFNEVDLGPKNEENIVYNEETEINSFLSIPQWEQQAIKAIQEQLSSTHHDEAISWPKVDTDQLNEYKTPFLTTMAFPTLFTNGKGDDLTNLSLYKDEPLGEAMKHLLKYAEKKDSKLIYCFASHPRLSYWALNSK